MATINTMRMKDFFEAGSDALVAPVPARIRNKKSKNLFIPATKKLFEKYQVAHEKYKEISQQSDSYSNGEVYILRDVDFKGLDIQNPEVDVKLVVEKMENDSKLIVLLPIKTREDKNIQDHVYLSSLRALANLLRNNEEVREQFQTIYIPDFPGISQSMEKVNEIFHDLDINIFVCFDSL